MPAVALPRFRRSLVRDGRRPPRRRGNGGVSAHLQPAAPGGEVATGEITYLEAIRAALADAMPVDDRVFLLGEDIGHFGGRVRRHEGALRGVRRAERCIDTPISEEGFVGAAIGAAWMGERPVVELQFADFVTCPFDPIVTVAAKTHWRSGIRLPIVIRAPFGGGVRGGPVPRLVPRGVVRRHGRAQGRLPGHGRGRVRAASRRDRRRRPRPLLRAQGALPPAARRAARRAAHRTPIGRARIVRAGGEATVVTYGAGVDLALRAVDGLDVEIARPAHGLAARRRRRSSSRSRRRRACSSSRRRRARSAPPGQVLSLVAREGFELLDAPPGARRAARHARSVRTGARGRVHPVRRTRRAEPGGAPCVLRQRSRRASRSTRRACPETCACACFHLMLLQRLAEERIIALYRQGRIAGSVYTGLRAGGGRRGRRASRSGPTTSCCRSTASRPATTRAASPSPTSFATSSARRPARRAAATATCTSGSRDRNVFPLVSMLGDLVPGRRSARRSRSSGAASRGWR